MVSLAEVNIKGIPIARPAFAYSFVRQLFLGLVLTAIVLMPLLFIEIPPLFDYPLHIMRMKILADPEAPFIRDFFQVDTRIMPNLAMDLIVPAIAQFVSVETAGRIFVGLVLVLQLWGTIVLHRVIHGRWSPMALVVGLVLFNWILAFGFVNYLFGTGLMMWALAAHFALRNAPWGLRLAVDAVSAFVLFICHLFPMVLFALVIGSYEIGRWLLNRRTESFGQLVRTLALYTVPFIAPMAVFFLGSDTAERATEISWRLSWKLTVLPTALATGNLTSDIVTSAGILLCLAVAFFRGWLTFHRPFWFTATALAITFMIMPWKLFGSFHADTRLMAAVPLLAIVMVDVVRGGRRGQVLVGAFLIALFGGRIAAVTTDWVQSQPVLDQYREAFRQLKPGSVMFTVTADRGFRYPWQEGGAYWRPPVPHAANLALLETPMLAAQTYLVFGHSSVLFDPRFQPISDLQTQRRWAGPGPYRLETDVEVAGFVDKAFGTLETVPFDFSSVYLLIVDPDRKLSVPAGAKTVAEGAGFRIVELVRPPATPAVLSGVLP